MIDAFFAISRRSRDRAADDRDYDPLRALLAQSGASLSGKSIRPERLTISIGPVPVVKVMLISRTL